MNNSRSVKGARRRLNPRKTPGQARSAETVAAILEGAAHILEGRGFTGYNTNEIAARAGVSIGSLYQYFPGKDAITLALIERESAGLVEEMDSALRLENPRQALRAMIGAAVRHQLRRPRLARLLDIEQDRLAGVMPASSHAASARAMIIAFLRRAYGLREPQITDAVLDLMEIVRALTDAAGRRQELHAGPLAERIEGAVLGYLDARRRTD
jgi:AcrR family transcriptional regulator